jgi:hypothetical protein
MGCPADYPDSIMERAFYGTVSGCDCIGVYGKSKK